MTITKRKWTDQDIIVFRDVIIIVSFISGSINTLQTGNTPVWESFLTPVAVREQCGGCASPRPCLSPRSCLSLSLFPPLSLPPSLSLSLPLSRSTTRMACMFSDLMCMLQGRASPNLAPDEWRRERERDSKVAAFPRVSLRRNSKNITVSVSPSLSLPPSLSLSLF